MHSSLHAPPHAILRRMIPGLLLGVLVLIVLILLGDIKQVGIHLQAFNWVVFPFALLLTLFNYTLRFFKWHYYLRQIGIHNLPLHQSLRLFVSGFPLAVTPGKVGEILKGVWLEQKTGIPAARGVSVVVAERISDGLAVLALSILGVVAYPRYWPVFLLVLGLLLTLVIGSQIRPVVYWAIGLGERLPLVQRFMPLLREFYEGSFTLFRPGALLVGVGLGIISWLGEGIGFYLILLGLGLTPSLELLGLAVFVLAFSTVIGAASALPGGLGAAEVSIAGMLALLQGVDPATASAATLLIRLATFWFGIALGLIFWLFSHDLLGFPSHIKRRRHVDD